MSLRPKELVSEVEILVDERPYTTKSRGHAMPNLRLWDEEAAEPCLPRAKTPINFFVQDEKSLVEQSYRLDNRCSKKHRAPIDIDDFSNLLELRTTVQHRKIVYANGCAMFF